MHTVSSCTGVIEDLCVKWSCMYTETAQWMPGSPWTSNWKFVLTVYVSAPADVYSTLDNFMEVSLIVLFKCMYMYMYVFLNVRVCVSY